MYELLYRNCFVLKLCLAPTVLCIWYERACSPPWFASLNHGLFEATLSNVGTLDGRRLAAVVEAVCIRKDFDQLPPQFRQPQTLTSLIKL